MKEQDLEMTKVKTSQLTKDHYSVGEVANFLHVAPGTIRLWDAKGLIKTVRTPTNIRQIEKEELINVLTAHYRLEDDLQNKFSVIILKHGDTTSALSKRVSSEGLSSLGIEENEQVKTLIIFEDDLEKDARNGGQSLQSLLEDLSNKMIYRIFVNSMDVFGENGVTYMPTIIKLADAHIKTIPN